jgi:acetolactate synthase-1/2/3 large subunit
MANASFSIVARKETARHLSGGRAIAEMIKLAGTGAMFGMGGFQLLPFYDAMNQLGLKHYLINDERNAAFAADAYARVTNRTGVCDATLGPGATNLVTGLVESTNAGIPIVALVGDTNRGHSWKNMTQEARQVEILRPAVKELIRLETPARIPELLRRAFSVATAGRPGAVVIDVPEDVAHAECEYANDEFWIDAAVLSVPGRRSRPDATDVERAAALIGRARRPLLLIGGGIHLSQGYEALRNLAEGMSIPVAHTISGKGGIACTHPLSAGLFGRYSRIANDMIEAADLLIVVGCKMGEIATKRYQLPSKYIPTIHLEVLAEEIGRTMHVDIGLVGDARAGLEDLCASLQGEMKRESQERNAYAREVPARMSRWHDEVAQRLYSDEQPIGMARLITEINKAMPKEGIFIGDGGFAGHWTGLLWNTKMAGRTYIADRGFASIGCGLPAAIGAQLTAPNRPVVALTGDGGFNMTMGDLETARRVGANPIMVIVNNAASGYVKALQHAMMGGRYQSSDLVEMDYAAIANAMGCRGIRVERPAELANAFQEALAKRDRPVVVDVVVTRDPSKMLPGVDNRTAKIAKGDRIA